MFLQLKVFFKKAGGLNLLKQWLKLGILPVTFIEFLILGYDKKSLELLRLIAGLKIQKKLKKKYGKLQSDFKLEKREGDSILQQMIWIFWWQGMDNAPLVVQKCYDSVKRNFPDWKITVLTADNYQDYVSFPDYIEEKRNKGIISLTHFSDLMRLELLIKYGGLWLDATVFCTGHNIPRSILKSDIFVFQTQKPGADGHATLMSNWLIYAKANNHLLMSTQLLLYDYWKKSNQLIDYFLFHHFFTIASSRFPLEAAKIPPFCNTVPHILLLHFFDKYDEDLFEDLKNMTCFYKLSYKFTEEDMDKKGTFYDVIINGSIQD